MARSASSFQGTFFIIPGGIFTIRKRLCLKPPQRNFCAIFGNDFELLSTPLVGRDSAAWHKSRRSNDFFCTQIFPPGVLQEKWTCNFKKSLERRLFYQHLVAMPPAMPPAMSSATVTHSHPSLPKLDASLDFCAKPSCRPLATTLRINDHHISMSVFNEYMNFIQVI